MSTKSESIADIGRKNESGKKAPATRRAADVAHGVIDDTAAKAEVVEQQLRQQATKAGEKVEASQEAAAKKIDTSLAKAEAFAKEQPITAAGIAFAAGVITTALLRR